MAHISVNGVFVILLAFVNTGRPFPTTHDPSIPAAGRYIENDTEICYTKECLTMDEHFLKKIDLQQDPCEDFFQFTCGKYINSNVTTNYKINNEYEEAVTVVKKQLHNIIKEMLNENDTRALKMAKEMYQLCINHKSGAEDVKKLIKHVGGWSLTDKTWTEANFSLDKFYSKSWEIGYIPKSLFTIEVLKDIKNSKNAIHIGNPYSRNYSEKIESKHSVCSYNYMNLVSDVYLHKLIPIITKKLEVDLVQTCELFKEFIEINKLVMASTKKSVLKHMKIQLQYRWVTVTDMKKKFSNIPWSAIIQPLFQPIPINDNETIILECPECLASINDVIGSIPKKSLNNYLMWSLIIDTLIEVDANLLEAWLKTFKTNKNRKAYCAEFMIEHFRRSFDYEYIKRHFDESLQSEVSNFTQILNNAMKEVMCNSTRIGPKTKDRAISKLTSVVFQIAYDDKINNEQKLREYYADLNINQSSYFDSLMNILKFKKHNNLQNLRKPASLSSHYFKATMNKIAYSRRYNAIYISAPFLGHIFYSRKRPQYLNYGGLGFLTGHELNHALDPRGIHFNEQGAYETWMDKRSVKKYRKISKCLAQQYSEFTNKETGNKVNGKKTLTENFADNGGILVAYKAYEKYLKHSKDPPLPHFKQFTSRQMFWISTVSISCSKHTKEIVARREKNDVHALEYIRANGRVMNSEDFASDWNCKPKAPMNPNKKCAVWK